MKRLLLLLNLLTAAAAISLAQMAPASVCTYPESYTYEDTVTWYFDLTGNPGVEAGENLYLWSWEPVELPAGRALLTYEGNMTWSLTFVPVDLYGVSRDAIEAAGDAAFWSNLQDESGVSVTGTIPYAQKELLRLGNPCQERKDRTFYLDFGPDDGENGNATSSPDPRGIYWNNPTDGSTSADPLFLVDGNNVPSSITLSILSELWTNGILNGGLLEPEEGSLGELAVASATQDYFFQTSSGKISLNGLDPGRGYVFSLFASRNTEQERITRYTFRGANQVVDSLQSSGTDIGGQGFHGNNSHILVSGPVIPDPYGRIRITLEALKGGFGYLNLMKIEEGPLHRSLLVDLGPEEGIHGILSSGPDSSGFSWNNAVQPPQADSLMLNDVSTRPTGIYLQFEGPWLSEGLLNGGLQDPDPELIGDLALPSATADFIYSFDPASLVLGGLDTSRRYVLSLFASKDSVVDLRTTFQVSGREDFSGILRTSGPDLGGAGINGNRTESLVSDTLFPAADGTLRITLSPAVGDRALIACLKLEEILPLVEAQPLCASRDPLLIAVMGSSVAYGTGASGDRGYAWHLGQELEHRYTSGEGAEWRMENISIGGNNTVAVMNRWEADLLPLCGSYVIYGLSLGNEGIYEQGLPAFDQFALNMQKLIDTARAAGIEPVVVNCYTRNDFRAIDYNYTKQMNLMIHTWDVASVNVLGAVDDGSGRWSGGYWNDSWHPNTAGHLEFFHAFVPSLFDALSEGKPQPVRAGETWLTMPEGAPEFQLEFTPEGTVHPFTVSFRIRTSGSGVVGGFTQAEGYGMFRIRPEDGKLSYLSPGGGLVRGDALVNDGQWHSILLSHYHARGETFLYVDGSLQGSVEEVLIPVSFFLGSEDAPEADFKEWFFYRSALNGDEVIALEAGEMLKSSLALYAPLDGEGRLGSDTLVNLAQSTNRPFKADAGQLPVGLLPEEINGNSLLVLHPNPSRGFVDISLSLKGDAKAEVSVLDLQGRLVATPFQGEVQAGDHSFRWEDPQAAAGTYFCRVTLNGRPYMEKMILLR